MSDILLEIGTEELPARFIGDAQKQLKTNTRKWFEEANIDVGQITVFSTPRRLTVIVENVAGEQKTTEEEIRGPQLKAAKDADGEWTKAALGFTRGQGKTVDDLYIKTIKDTEYIFVNKTTIGKQTANLLPALKDIIDSLNFPQTMRWGSNSYRFPRPLRWITALYGDQIIPMEVAGVSSGNVTHGHRFLGNDVVITSPSNYELLLEKEYVIVDPEKRKAMILEGIRKLETKASFHVEVDEDLLDEVCNLVEYPTVFYGEFERDYLKLPKEVLITSMKEHQRYFPVFNKEQEKLLSFFVSVRNGDSNKIENVIRGNEKVLRARLQDAAFFYEEDQRHTIDDYNEKLKKVVFQEKIGTVYEKTVNIRELSAYILEQLEADAEVRKTTLRAAEISKFDLVTDMVNEFTELQGIMGEKYALLFKEAPDVAQAIREHYMPVQSNGVLPETVPGAVVSIADKMDTIAGCFSVGLIPTGSQDPNGLRRQATGVLRILLANHWDIKLEDLIAYACKGYNVTDKSVMEAMEQFFSDRAVYLFAEEKVETDVVRAVLNDHIGIFHYTRDKAVLLSNKKNREDFKSVQEALVRVMNIAKKADAQTEVNPSLFETDSEAALYENYLDVHEVFGEAEHRHEASKALEELARLETPIHAFFEHNMVMANDEQVRENRLALANLLSSMIRQFADLTLIEWKQHNQSR